MADTIRVVNRAALAVCPGDQLIEPGTPVEVDASPQVQELIDTGVLDAIQPKAGRAPKTTARKAEED